MRYSLVFLVGILLVGACVACDIATSSSPLIRSIVRTHYGPVQITSDMPITADDHLLVLGEVDDGYRRGAVLWDFALPETDTFTVRLIESTGPYVAGFYEPYGHITVEAGFRALDDELQHHFCYYGVRTGELPAGTDC
jgi:hypothetical protein